MKLYLSTPFLPILAIKNAYVSAYCGCDSTSGFPAIYCNLFWTTVNELDIVDDWIVVIFICSWRGWGWRRWVVIITLVWITSWATRSVRKLVRTNSDASISFTETSIWLQPSMAFPVQTLMPIQSKARNALPMPGNRAGLMARWCRLKITWAG